MEAPRLEGIDGKGTDLSRILALSDGVFGFALTFLAITLVLPATLKGESLPALPQYLRSLQTAFLGYILSFFIIAAWWNVHHRLFSSFVRYDPTLVRLNSFFLLIVSVNPFLVSLLFAYGPDDFAVSSISARLAVAIYAAVEALGGAALFAIWRHATRGHRLVAPVLPPEWIRSTERNLLFNLGTFTVSIGVAFVSPLAAELVWIGMIFGISHRILRAPRHPPRSVARPATHELASRPRPEEAR